MRLPSAMDSGNSMREGGCLVQWILASLASLGVIPLKEEISRVFFFFVWFGFFVFVLFLLLNQELNLTENQICQAWRLKSVNPATQEAEAKG